MIEFKLVHTDIVFMHYEVFKDGEFVGSFGVKSADPTYLDWIYIKIGKQRDGIGTAILEKQNIKSLYCSVKNTAAIAFYEKNCFVNNGVVGTMIYFTR